MFLNIGSQVIEQRNSRPGIFWPVSRESLHNFLISFDRLIASKTFACRVFYGRQTAQMDGRTWSWSWGLQQSNSQGVEDSKTRIPIQTDSESVQS